MFVLSRTSWHNIRHHRFQTYKIKTARKIFARRSDSKFDYR
jgi:hypothetical protein